MHPFTIRNNKDYTYQALNYTHTPHSAVLLRSHFKPPYNSNKVVLHFLRTEELKPGRLGSPSKVTGLSDSQDLDPSPPDAKTHAP